MVMWPSADPTAAHIKLLVEATRCCRSWLPQAYMIGCDTCPMAKIEDASTPTALGAIFTAFPESEFLA